MSVLDAVWEVTDGQALGWLEAGGGGSQRLGSHDRMKGKRRNDAACQKCQMLLKQGFRSTFDFAEPLKFALS